MLTVRNNLGTFVLEEYGGGIKRWLCQSRTKAGRQFSVQCFVPLNYGSELSKEARANGATDADFGIKPPKPVKVKGTRKSGGKRKPRETPGQTLWDFSDL